MPVPSPAPVNIEQLALPDIICDRLREDIASGLYQPKQPIRIRSLAERFGVSTMPVREALRRLEAEGLVRFDKNRSITVRELTRAEAKELFDMRRALEPLAGRRATPTLRHDSGALAHLTTLIEQMDHANGPRSWGSLNEEFHRTIYNAADMPRLSTVLSSLWAASEVYINRFHRTPEHIAEAQAQHRTLYAAIVGGDVAKVERLIRGHVTWGERAITHDLEERQVLENT